MFAFAYNRVGCEEEMAERWKEEEAGIRLSSVCEKSIFLFFWKKTNLYAIFQYCVVAEIMTSRSRKAFRLSTFVFRCLVPALWTESFDGIFTWRLKPASNLIYLFFHNYQHNYQCERRKEWAEIAIKSHLIASSKRGDTFKVTPSHCDCMRLQISRTTKRAIRLCLFQHISHPSQP